MVLSFLMIIPIALRLNPAQTQTKKEFHHWGDEYDKIEIPDMYYKEDTFFPVAFDAREYWPNCPSIRKVLDYRQFYGDLHYGHDAALAIASLLTDRYCTTTNGTRRFEFSAMDILECCKHFDVAYENGKYLDADPMDAPLCLGLKCAVLEGVVSGGEMGCKPYTHQVHSTCHEGCTNQNYSDSYKYDKKYVQTISKQRKSNFGTIKAEIFSNGPVVTRIIARDSFNRTINQSTIYMDDGPDKKDINVKFVVVYLKVIGWGGQDDIPYWLVTNFWGDKWQDGGFFKILEEKHYLDFGQSVYAAYFKDTSFSRGFTTVETNEWYVSKETRRAMSSYLLKCLVGMVILVNKAILI